MLIRWSRWRMVRDAATIRIRRRCADRVRKTLVSLVKPQLATSFFILNGFAVARPRHRARVRPLLSRALTIAGLAFLRTDP
jgi:hypothetical protein